MKPQQKNTKKTNQNAPKKNKERNVTKTISTSSCCNYSFISITQTKKCTHKTSNQKKLCNRVSRYCDVFVNKFLIILNRSIV